MSRITLDMPDEDEIEAGDYVRSEAGTSWVVDRSRQVRRRIPEAGRSRWALDVVRIPAAEMPGDARIWDFEWYPRGRRR